MESVGSGRARTETTRWRLLVFVSAAWGLFVVALYSRMIVDLPAAGLRKLLESAQAFFLWQAAGFLLLGLVVSMLWPRGAGRIAAIYLSLSTLVLLGLPREPSLPLSWLAFTLLGFLAINTTRLALERFLGAEVATWGLAGGVLYCILIPLTLLMGVLNLMTAAVALTVVGVLALPGLVDLLRAQRRVQRSLLTGLDALNPIGVFSLGILWLSLAITFVWSMAPELDSDSSRSYLPHIQEIARDQGFTLQYLDFGRLFTKATIGIHAFGFVAAGSVHGAKWLSWFSVVALVLLVVDEVARRSKRRNLGLFAGATVLSCPLLLSLSKSLFHDHLIVLPCTAAFVSLFRGFELGSRRTVLLSAFIMGCAAQTKYNVLIFVVVWVLALAIGAVKQQGVKAGLRACLLPLSVLGASGCPWYVYTFLTTGNPFFPMFETLFPLSSPLAERFSPMGFGAAGGLAQFTFGDSFWDRLFFPWTITFHTARIGHLANGGMGFQLLALLPALGFYLLLRRNRWRAGLDLGLAGLVGFLGVCLHTPYPRYWLPVYPLLLMSLILPFGLGLDRTRWRFPRFIIGLAGAALFVALMSTIPFWASKSHRLPWQVFTNEISEDDWIALHYPGYRAIEQLNGQLKPGDRVISSRYTPNYTVDAEIYNLPRWRLKLYKIRDAESFRKYLDEHSIDYWIIDHSHMDATHFDDSVEASRYWTDERLVAAFGSVAVYDVSPEPRASRFRLVDSRMLEPTLLPSSLPWVQTIDQPGWVIRFAHETEPTVYTEAGAIELPERSMVEHRFTFPLTTHFVRLSLRVRGDGHGAIARLSWLDADRKMIETVASGARALPTGHQSYVFGVVPEQAGHAIFSLTPFRSKTVEVGELKIDFLSRHNPAPRAGDGVQR